MNEPSPQGQTPEQTANGALATEWESWIVENLLADAPPEALKEALVEQGLSASRAAAEVARIHASPAFQYARRLHVYNQRLTLGNRLLCQLEKDAGVATTIDRRPGLSAADFYDHYFRNNQPVVVPGMAAGWPAYGTWSPSYLREAYGEATIEMMADRDQDPDCNMRTEQHRRFIAMEEFVDKVEQATEPTNDFYLVATNKNIDRPPLSSLLEDVVLDADFFDATRRKTYHSFWFGPRGTHTPLHHDDTNVFFFQLYGTKHFYLISPRETALLRHTRLFYNEFDASWSVEERPPQFRDVAVKSVELAPGDGLFIPVGWWHQVDATAVSISFSCMNFHRPNKFGWYAPGKRV